MYTNSSALAVVVTAVIGRRLTVPAGACWVKGHSSRCGVTVGFSQWVFRTPLAFCPAARPHVLSLVPSFYGRDVLTLDSEI